MRFIYIFIATLLILQASFSEDLSDFQNTATISRWKMDCFLFKASKKVVSDKCLTTDSDSDSDDNGGGFSP